MATNLATLDADLAVNPLKARKIRLVTTHIDHPAKALSLDFELADLAGLVVDLRTLTIQGAAITTWINNQETIIMNQLFAKLGITGVIG